MVFQCISVGMEILTSIIFFTSTRNRRPTKKSTRKRIHWPIRCWRPKSWTCCNKRWTTTNWRKVPTKRPRHWTEVWPNSLWWLPIRNHWKFSCICHCCAKTKMFRTFSFVLSKRWAVHAACRVQSWPVRSPSTRDRSWNPKLPPFNRKLNDS